LFLDPSGHGQRGEHDRQVRLDRLALVMVDRHGAQVVLGHPERLLDLEQPMVGVDDELGGCVGQVCDVALQAGQAACPRRQGLVGAGQLDEPVAVASRVVRAGIPDRHWLRWLSRT
jgi:hypothetical protein